MKLDNINQISQEMSTTYSKASVDLSSIIRDLLLPIISVKDNKIEAVITIIFNYYPSLFLLEGLIEIIFSQSNLNSLTTYAENKVFESSDTSDTSEDSEVTAQKMGGMYYQYSYYPRAIC